MDKNLLGQLIGDCAIVSLLGEGGMGSVYKAKHQKLKIDVAVKVIAKSLIDREPTFIERFYREAQSAAQLNHPNIMRVFNVGEDKGHHYLIIEYIDGPTVRHLIKKQDKLSPEAAVSMIIQALLGLRHAHSKGILHRDIKPENLMINSEGVLKITDFGLARPMQSKQSITLTTEGQILGTPAFMPPEQWHAEKLDESADIYALGITLYNMLSNRYPAEGEVPTVILSKIIAEDLTPLSEFEPDLPEELLQIVDKMIALKKEDRFSSCNQVLQALKKFYANLDKKKIRKARATLLSLSKDIYQDMKTTFVSVPNDITDADFTEDDKFDKNFQTLPNDLSSAARTIIKKIETAYERDDLLSAAQYFHNLKKIAPESKETLDWQAILETADLPTQNTDAFNTKSKNFDEQDEQKETMLESEILKRKSKAWLATGLALLLVAIVVVGLALKNIQKNEKKSNNEQNKTQKIVSPTNPKNDADKNEKKLIAKIKKILSGENERWTDFSKYIRELENLDPQKARSFLKQAGYIKLADAPILATALPDLQPLDALFCPPPSINKFPFETRKFQKVGPWKLSKIIGDYWLNHLQKLTAASLSPDAKFILTAGLDGVLALWDVATGKLILNSHLNSGSITSARFSTDGKYCIITTSNSLLKPAKLLLIDAHNLALIAETQAHRTACSVLAFSANGKLFLTTSLDKRVKLFETQTLKELHVFSDFKGIVIGASFSKDGKYIAFADMSGAIALFDRKKNKLKKIQPARLPVLDVAFSPDSKNLLIASADKTAKLFNISDEKIVRTFEGHQAVVSRAIFSNDGRFVLTGSNAGNVFLRNAKTGKRLKIFRHNIPVIGIAISSDNKFVLAKYKSGTPKLWDVRTAREIRKTQKKLNSITSICLSPDAKKAVCLLNYNKLAIVNIETSEIEKIISLKIEKNVRYKAVLFSDDLKFVFVLSDAKKFNRFARRWLAYELATGKIIEDGALKARLKLSKKLRTALNERRISAGEVFELTVPCSFIPNPALLKNGSNKLNKTRIYLGREFPHFEFLKPAFYEAFDAPLAASVSRNKKTLAVASAKGIIFIYRKQKK